MLSLSHQRHQPAAKAAASAVRSLVNNHGLQDDLKRAYKRAVKTVQVYSPGWLQCPGTGHDVSATVSNFMRSSLTCAGTGDWEETFWTMLVTAEIARRFKNPDGVASVFLSGNEDDAVDNAIEYMDLARDPDLYGWHPDAPRTCPHSDGKMCEQSYVHWRNVRHGAQVYRDARVMYAGTCNFFGHCREPSHTHLARLVFLRACEATFSENLHWTYAMPNRPLHWALPGTLTAHAQQACAQAAADELAFTNSEEDIDPFVSRPTPFGSSG